MTSRIPGWLKIAQGLRGNSVVCAAPLIFLALLQCSVANAASACTEEALLGWWALQSTNSVIAVSPTGSADSPFARGPGSGSASTTFVELRKDGSAVIEERFIRGHRASDIILLRSETNTWNLHADCRLEIVGMLPTGYLEHPHRLHGKISADSARFQGMREIEDQYSGVNLLYVITGDRL